MENSDLNVNIKMGKDLPQSQPLIRYLTKIAMSHPTESGVAALTASWSSRHSHINNTNACKTRYGLKIVGITPTEPKKAQPHKTRADGLITVASLF